MTIGKTETKQAEKAAAVTDHVARLATTVRYEDIPEAARKVAQQAIIDCIGVTLAGATEPVSKLVASYVRSLGAKETAGVLGFGFKTAPAEAALVNGTASHAMDYDDYLFMAGGHPSVTLVPAALAAGQVAKATGKDLITAYLLGLELEIRIGREMAAQILIPRGFHSTPVWGPLGAALSASRLFKLDVQQTRRAIGISTAGSGGLRANFGTMTKPLHAGNAARAGIMAAVLARDGFTADESVLEAPLGYMRAWGQWKDGDEVRFLDGLEEFTLSSGGLAFKPYASCGISHHSITAALALAREHHITADQVVEVESTVNRTVTVTLRYFDPQTPLEGKFSLHYCLAVALLDGRAGLAQFTPEKVKDPRVRDLIKKVKISYTSNELDWSKHTAPQTVRIKLKDGREFTKTVVYGKGDPHNPMSDDETADKYRDCASTVLPKDKVERSLDMLINLDKQKDAAALVDLLT